MEEAADEVADEMAIEEAVEEPTVEAAADEASMRRPSQGDGEPAAEASTSRAGARSRSP